MDAISNMIIMLKNASISNRESIFIPASKLIESLAQCLVKAGFLISVSKTTRKNKNVLELTIAYDREGKSKINGVDRISKPSKRVYLGNTEIRSVKNGRGILVLSTPKGILTDREARKELVGGEAMFTMW